MVPSPSVPPILAAETAPAVDYARAYSLRRPGLTKASLSLGLTALALSILALAGVAGIRGWFMPGISSAHGRIVGTAPRVSARTGEGGDPAATPLDPSAAAAAARGCLACHRPWRGPVDTGCVECHAAQAAPHAARQAIVHACHTCHPEHRPGQTLIAAGEATGCVSCHGDLTLAVGEPRVARQIASFADQHPELVVTPLIARSGAEGAGAPTGSLRAAAEGMSLATPGARSSDPGRLAFNHSVHLAPDLRGPRGAVQLACDACHAVVSATGLMAPIAFAEHCQGCHSLTFDSSYPDRQAPHATPQEVEDFLVGLYSRADASAGADQSLRRRRLGIIRGGGRRRLPPGVDRQVADAGRTLFRSQCDLCHQMDLDASPLPVVVAPELPVRWFARARFSHLDHGEVACNECHLSVAESRETSDVLLPGIAECRSCHGGEAARAAAGWGGLLGCAQCHAYHPSPTPPASAVTAAVLTHPDTGSSLISTTWTMQPEENRR